MISLGVSVLIKETWNWLCFGRIYPKPSREPSSWPTDEPLCYNWASSHWHHWQCWHGDKDTIQKQSCWILLLKVTWKTKQLPCLASPGPPPESTRNRSGAQQSYWIGTFLGQHINRDGIAVVERKRQTSKKRGAVKRGKCEIKKEQKAEFELSRSQDCLTLCLQNRSASSGQDNTCF